MKKIAIILPLLLFGCNKKFENKKVQFENEWKKDNLGCKKKRSIALQEKLLNENHLKNSTIEEFEKTFGKPNEIETKDNITILIYYTSTICNSNQEVIPDSDKGYANFYFENNRLTKYDNPIE